MSGIHGAGAARYAADRRGAVMRVASGPMGQSYAIPTKDRTIRYLLSYPVIQGYVDDFIDYAQAHPELQFQITQIGCGLAGGNPDRIAPMFEHAPVFNCFIDEKWKQYLPLHTAWGSI